MTPGGVDTPDNPNLRRYRIIESCSNEMNFSRLQTANFEGLLAASQEISRQQAAEIQPLYYSQLKMEQDVGWIFRSGNAERREAMQRIVDRSDSKPGYAPASAQAGRRQRRAGIQRMRAGWSRLPQAVARLLSEKDAHRCCIFI